MSLHLNLQCQRADKNTDTRMTPPVEEAWSIWFFATASVAVKAVRCGSTYLREPPRDVNRVFSKILDREPVGLISLETPLIVGENANGRLQRKLAMSTQNRTFEAASGLPESGRSFSSSVFHDR